MTDQGNDNNSNEMIMRSILPILERDITANELRNLVFPEKLI